MTRTVSAGLILAVMGFVPLTANAESKPLPGAVRAAFAARACNTALKAKFEVGPKRRLDVDQYKADNTPAGGDWSVRFDADVTETATSQARRYLGVCHVPHRGHTTVEVQPAPPRSVQP